MNIFRNPHIVAVTKLYPEAYCSKEHEGYFVLVSGQPVVLGFGRNPTRAWRQAFELHVKPKKKRGQRPKL